MEAMYKWAVINKDNKVIDFANRVDWVKYPISKGYNFIKISSDHLFIRIDNCWIYRP